MNKKTVQNLSFRLFTSFALISCVISLFFFYTFSAFSKNQTKSPNENAILTHVPSKAVLGTSDQNIDDTITFHVKTSFDESVVFNKSAEFKDGLSLNGKDLDLGSGKLTAANVVYSVTTGDGLSVTGGQNPKLTNSGVLSVGGKTGALTITGGTGITISGLEITNSDLGSSQKIFKTITIGSTSFSAGSNTDTLTFAAGTGITITPDTTNKKLTLSTNASDLTVAGGWTDGGTTIALSTITDSVGIGVASPSTKLHIVGTTEQIRLGYDLTSYTSMTVDSSGNLTVAPSGGTFSITGALSASNGLTVSSGSVSVPSGSIANSALANSAVTVTAGSGMSGGGSVSLGGTVTLTNAGVTSLTGTSNQVTVSGSTGAVTLSLPQSIATTSAPTFGGASINGATTIAPSASGAIALTVRASSTSPGNILDLTNAAGSTSYLSVGSTGALTVGGSTLTNSGLLESGGAIHLTNSANAVVGTAIEGGWTMNSNTFTYRRIMTVNNNDGSNALPTNYEVTVSLSGSTASQIYTNSQSDYDDFRIAYSSDGVTFTEIARNVTSFTSSSVAFTYQLQAQIAASGTSSNYYIYYKNSSLSTPAAAYASYTGNTQIDSLDTTPTSNWTSADTTQFPLSDEATVKNEGTGSLKSSATVDNIGTFSTTSQNALPAASTNFGFTSSSIGGTTYLYAVGGSTDGTAGSGQTTVYRTSVAAASGNVAAWSTNSNSLSAAVLDNSLAVATPPFDTGTGSDGSIDLANGSGAGGCTGTGLSWSGSTCTIATATKSTFNFTTITIPVGTTLTTDGPKTTTNFVTIKATGAVTVAGTIDLSGKGYSGGGASTQTPGNGPGAGACSSCSAGGGAGYGGAGGQGGGFSARTAAGATYSTDDSGSGGATGNGSGATGGAGGGGIKIISGGTVTVSGTLNTNGSNGGAVSGNTGGGGGSGGRIYLQGSTLTISGSLTSNGGNGASGAPSTSYGGGGGGGGRITLEYSGSLDTTGSTITVTNGTGGTGTWTGTASGLAGSAGTNTSTASKHTLYVLGGKNTSGTAQSGISQGTITASDGSVGAFSASSVSLPQTLFGQTSNVVTVGTTNYLYIIGGNNGTTDQTTVYKGTFSGANISAIATTSQTQLGTGISYPATVTGSISSTNYIWVLGGLNGSTAQTSVYRGTIDASGNITALSTTSQGALPQALYGHKAIFVTVGSNNYIYVYGGMTTGGTRQTTVYKASVDASGNVGTFTTVGQTQLSSAISDFGAFNFTDSDSNQYAYIVGGNTGTVQSAVLKTKYTPIDQTGYSMSRTITSNNWSNKNDLTYQVYSSRTGSYMNLQFYDATGGWQTCTFSVSSANTWETKTCDISGVSSVNKDAVTSLKVQVSSSTTTAWTMYLDDINAKTNASTFSNATSALAAVLGASNLTLNAQGTGLVAMNYDPSSGQAGTGGMKLYDGAAGLLFSLSSTGDASASGAMTLTGASASARMNILNGQNFMIQTSVGGDAGLASRFTILNTGNIGIGTTTPAFRFDVSDTQTATVAAMLSNADAGASGDVLALKTSATTAGTGNNFLTFINGNGQIVGKVNGNGAGGVTYATTGIDFAEYYKKASQSAEIVAGDVVCLQSDGGVSLCKGVNPQPLGIVSGKPGFVGGSSHEDDPSYALVGLVGQLPVKVSSASGVIKPSDPIVQMGGVVRRANEKGYIVGRSLEAYDPAKEPEKQTIMVSINVAWYDPNPFTGTDGMFSQLVLPAQAPSSVFEGESATISGKLMVLGRTTLSDLGVTGNINAGLISIHGLDGEINTLSGPLKLQSSGIGGIEMLGGVVSIDTLGNVKTSGSITSEGIHAKELHLGEESSGSSILKAGETRVVVTTSVARPTSKIFITPTTLTEIQLAVVEKNDGSFIVGIKNTNSSDIHFDWLIVGVK